MADDLDDELAAIRRRRKTAETGSVYENGISARDILPLADAVGAVLRLAHQLDTDSVTVASTTGAAIRAAVRSCLIPAARLGSREYGEGGVRSTDQPPMMRAIESHLRAMEDDPRLLRAHLQAGHGFGFVSEYAPEAVAQMESIHRQMPHPHASAPRDITLAREPQKFPLRALDRPEMAVVEMLVSDAGEMLSELTTKLGPEDAAVREVQAARDWLRGIRDTQMVSADAGPSFSVRLDQLLSAVETWIDLLADQGYHFVPGETARWRGRSAEMSDMEVLARADELLSKYFHPSQSGFREVTGRDPVGALRDARYMIQPARRIAERLAASPTAPSPLHLHEVKQGKHTEGEQIRYYQPETGYWVDGVFWGWEREGELARISPAGGDASEAGVIRAANLRWAGEPDVIFEEEGGDGVPGQEPGGDGPQDPD